MINLCIIALRYFYIFNKVPLYICPFSPSIQISQIIQSILDGFIHTISSSKILSFIIRFFVNLVNTESFPFISPRKNAPSYNSGRAFLFYFYASFISYSHSMVDGGLEVIS